MASPQQQQQQQQQRQGAPRVVPVAKLDWPETSDTHQTSLLCAGDAFLDYELRRMELRDLRHGSSFYDGDDDNYAGNNSSSDDDDVDSLSPSSTTDLFALSHDELEKLTYYQILNDIPIHSTQDDIKKAYRKACLTYHPDKTGRGEQDEVFLSVKIAFETLSDVSKRKAYDSLLDFDDSIPAGGENDEDFYTAYAPVFERNLRFDARNDPSMNGKKGKQSKKQSERSKKPPSLGNDDTPIDDVHSFYDYWIHFDSWRDFTLEATKQLKDYDVENADSRYEKRFYEKEINKRAKQLKKEEMARINLLVERAMAADPRLRRQRQFEREEKERLAQDRKEQEKQEKQRKREEAERRAREQAEREEAERQVKESARKEREKEKKQLRKARQLLRNMTVTAYQESKSGEIWKNLEDLNDDVELLCMKLSVVEITELTDAMGGSEAAESPQVAALTKIQACAETTKASMSAEEREAERRRDAARRAEAEKLRKAQAAKATNPWSKDELSALAKGVRKYPAGGANRWETITVFVNNLCKPEEPRTKEECIEKYNQMSKSSAQSVKKQSSTVSDDSESSATWTEEQDKQLQSGLSKYPATMDKNERWSFIAKEVDGKTKKECVQRFKAIREAIKNK